MKRALIIALLTALTGCRPEPTVPVEVTIIETVRAVGHTYSIVELPNRRRIEVDGVFGKPGDKFIMDVPERQAKEGK